MPGVTWLCRGTHYSIGVFRATKPGGLVRFRRIVASGRERYSVPGQSCAHKESAMPFENPATALEELTARIIAIRDSL